MLVIIRYVGTYFNVFVMVVPIMVMKFSNVDIFYKICDIFDLSSALTCSVESIQIGFLNFQHKCPMWSFRS